MKCSQSTEVRWIVESRDCDGHVLDRLAVRADSEEQALREAMAVCPKENWTVVGKVHVLRPEEYH